MMDTETTLMLTPSEVIEHIFCPRFTYFMNVLMIPQFEDRRYKVLKGREIHRQREKQNRDYLRKKIHVVRRERQVYLASPVLHVRGIVDEVLTLKDGTMAPLDYKYTPYREQAFKTHRIQVTLYGLVIREIYKCPVNRGYVAYIRNGGKLIEVPITEIEEQEALGVVAEIFDIICTGRIPRRTGYRKRCADCCYKNICA
jgi:CRISPR-associated exonuclease Cas4